MIRSANKQESLTHNEEENQSTETDSELIKALELADKVVKTVIMAVFYKFKKLSRDIEDNKHLT
jgi:hypothetical protein